MSGQSVYWHARKDGLEIIKANGEKSEIRPDQFGQVVLSLAIAQSNGWPASVGGVRIEPDLVRHLLADLAEAMR
jgi:hypothetical protein